MFFRDVPARVEESESDKNLKLCHSGLAQQYGWNV